VARIEVLHDENRDRQLGRQVPDDHAERLQTAR
jgi:hypothetical protein